MTHAIHRGNPIAAFEVGIYGGMCDTNASAVEYLAYRFGDDLRIIAAHDFL